MKAKLGYARRGVLFAAALFVMALSASTARADGPDGYPRSTVTIIVPFVPGGATDVVARHLAEALRVRWNKPVIVDNKAGASGEIGTAHVAKAKSDGLTLLLGTQTALAVSPTLSRSIPYSVDKDLTPISLLVTTPLVLLASEKSGGLSPALTAWLNQEVIAVLNDPAFQSKLSAQGFTPRPMQAAEFKQYIKSETDRFANLIRKNGVVVE